MSPMFLPRPSWEGWYDGASSSDDDSILSDVVPTNHAETIAQFIRRGKLYAERKQQRRERRESAEEATPVRKRYSGQEDAAFYKPMLRDDEDSSTGSIKPSRRRSLPLVKKNAVITLKKRRKSAPSKKGVRRQTKLKITVERPEMVPKRKSVVRKAKAPLVRRLPPPSIDDEGETEFGDGDVVSCVAATRCKDGAIVLESSGDEGETEFGHGDVVAVVTGRRYKDDLIVLNSDTDDDGEMEFDA